MKYSTVLPDSEKCVSMVTFRGQVLVATEKHIYRLVEDTLEPIKFIIKEDEIYDTLRQDSNLD